jgi:hypothetical protein
MSEIAYTRWLRRAVTAAAAVLAFFAGAAASEAGRGGRRQRQRRDPRLLLCARTRLRLLLSLSMLRLFGALLYACCRCRRWLGLRLGWRLGLGQALLGLRPVFP